MTSGAARNDVEIQLNQGASIVISKEADSVYLIVHEQLSAHIPTFECQPNVHFEGYQGSTYETMIQFKCYIKIYSRNPLVRCNIYLEIQTVANENDKFMYLLYSTCSMCYL